MKTFKTPKGTELPFLNLKGKDYLQVMHRLVWMREEHPNWGIETEFVDRNEVFAVTRATIRDENNRIIAQAHGREDQKHFPDYLEKCETKAIGRALGLCGYGTQFAPEFDEEDRIVDSPRPTQQKPPVSAPYTPKPAPQKPPFAVTKATIYQDNQEHMDKLVEFLDTKGKPRSDHGFKVRLHNAMVGKPWGEVNTIFEMESAKK